MGIIEKEPNLTESNLMEHYYNLIRSYNFPEYIGKYKIKAHNINVSDALFTITFTLDHYLYLIKITLDFRKVTLFYDIGIEGYCFALMSWGKLCDQLEDFISFYEKCDILQTFDNDIYDYVITSSWLKNIESLYYVYSLHIRGL